MVEVRVGFNRCVGPNWDQFHSAQVPSQLATRYLELGAGPNWEQFHSAQVPSQLAPRYVELGVGGPIGNNFIRPRFPVNLHQCL